MQKRTFLACLAMFLLPISAFATAHPFVSFALGSDRTNVYMSKNITLIPPFQNAYVGRNHYDIETVGGVFLGGEFALLQNWSLQLGLSYYQNSSFDANGYVYQFADPAFNNLNYQYQIQSRRFLIETKLSRAFKQIWHPYINLGLGESLNKAYSYLEYPTSSDNVPMTQPFANHTTRSFTYIAGLGIDVDIQKHIRVGAGYRFADLGNANLGTTPLQSGTTMISHRHLYTNEFLAQLSFLG